MIYMGIFSDMNYITMVIHDADYTGISDDPIGNAEMVNTDSVEHTLEVLGQANTVTENKMDQMVTVQTAHLSEVAICDSTNPATTLKHSIPRITINSN